MMQKKDTDKTLKFDLKKSLHKMKILFDRSSDQTFLHLRRIPRHSVSGIERGQTLSKEHSDREIEVENASSSPKTIFGVFSIITANTVRRLITLFIFGAVLCSPALIYASENLINNPSLELSSSTNTPSGWARGRWGTNTALFEYSDSGRNGGKSVKVTLTEHESGDAKWYFADINVNAGEELIFSDYYRASVQNYVTVRYLLDDGTYIYKDIKILPPSANWTKVEQSFIVPSGVVSLTIFHLINNVGTIETDDFSLSVVNVPPPPPPQTNNNIIENFSLEEVEVSGLPTNWYKGRWGTNTVNFEFPVTGSDSDRSAKITMTSRQSGDAKWYFKETPINPNKTYFFSNHYISDVSTYITAQYRLSNQTLKYVDLAVLPPSTNWSESAVSFQTPSDAVSITIFHLINREGELTIDNYVLKESSSSATLAEGMVTLSFDDGWKSIYENAIPILNNSDIKSTQYIVTGYLGFPAYVTKEQVIEMNHQGHEIANHTRTHSNLTTLTNEEREEQIFGARNDLNSLGVTNVYTFAYPFGAYNDDVIETVITSGALSARTTLNGHNTKSLFKPYEIKRESVEKNTTIEEIQEWIDRSISEKTWLVLAFHQVDNNGANQSTTPETFQKIIDYIKFTNIKTVTMKEGTLIINE